MTIALMKALILTDVRTRAMQVDYINGKDHLAFSSQCEAQEAHKFPSETYFFGKF